MSLCTTSPMQKLAFKLIWAVVARYCIRNFVHYWTTAKLIKDDTALQNLSFEILTCQHNVTDLIESCPQERRAG